MVADLSSSPRVTLDQFEGPLDVLLFLIRKNEVNIYDIPIARITAQYIELIEGAAELDLDDVTEFYVMAASLLHIKSQMLIPRPSDDEGGELEDPRQELVQRLIEYQRYRKLTELMAEREDDIEYQLERNRAQAILPFDTDETMWEPLDVWDLMKAFSRVVQALPSERLVGLYEEFTVNEKLTLIAELLDRTGEFSFTDLVRHGSIMEVVCAFIAILESARRRTIQIQQNRMFGDIRVVRGPGVVESDRNGDDNG